MSSARRSRREIMEDRMARSVRTPADIERARVEGRRQQRELIEQSLRAGVMTVETASDLWTKFDLGEPDR